MSSFHFQLKLRLRAFCDALTKLIAHLVFAVSALLNNACTTEVIHSGKKHSSTQKLYQLFMNVITLILVCDIIIMHRSQVYLSLKGSR